MSTRRERAKAQKTQQNSIPAVAAIAAENDHPVAKKLGCRFVFAIWNLVD